MNKSLIGSWNRVSASHLPQIVREYIWEAPESQSTLHTQVRIKAAFYWKLFDLKSQSTNSGLQAASPLLFCDLDTKSNVIKSKFPFLK